MDRHNELVQSLSTQVRNFHNKGIPFRIYHGATNSTRAVKKDVDKIIDTSTLNHVLSIDQDGLIAIVEPNVAMDALVEALLPHGVIPAVVPEFPGITVGGSYSGTAAESSSFREGYFDRTVNWVEIILADGEVVRASSTDNEDLFHGAAGALGTFGVTTLFEIRLLKVEMYVEVSYVITASISDTLDKILEIGTEAETCFLDAILSSPDSGVIIKGCFSKPNATQNLPIVQFSSPQDPWFFLHAHSKLQHRKAINCFTCSLLRSRNHPTSPPPLTELIPTKDYLFRYDRGAFWMGAYGWETLPLPFSPLGRRLLDPLFRTRTMYSVMHHSGQAQRFFVQDLAIPVQNAKAFLDFAVDEVGIWPLWLCPIRGGSRAPLHCAAPSFADEDTDIINVGIWGLPYKGGRNGGGNISYNRSNFLDFIALNRRIETMVRELSGLKWLYARNYKSEDEFWASYDREAYDALRKKWRADKMPSMWDKVGKTAGQWQSKNVLKGLWMGVLKKDYLVEKR